MGDRRVRRRQRRSDRGRGGAEPDRRIIRPTRLAGRGCVARHPLLQLATGPPSLPDLVVSERLIRISIPEQRLTLLEANGATMAYPVSTARNGPGERRGSGCTPRGWHRIRIRVGAGLPLNTVFVGRRPTGELYGSDLAVRHSGRDWILTRILWLTGLEPGYNRGGECDTLRRFIYIHGCPDTAPMGVPLSHGCIRMRNQDLLELFERVAAGDRVFIAD
ncbi:MAG: L,D-transpeptidase [Candidatus Competibacteraceae bacterium]|nr:L,D-transpeptidase [Candidatus Competibacteraceae bacterium]